MNYREFLESKMVIAPESGFDVDPDQINPALKPHQRDAVVWAVKGGKRACLRASVWERPSRSSSFAAW